MLFLALFSFLESQLCTSRGIQCYSSGLPLRFPFLWCISTAVQVACYVVYWISKALWSQTGDLIPLLSDRRNHLHVWATFLSVLAARLLPVLFKKKKHTHKLVCVGLQFINGCRKANSGCTWSNKLFIYVANRWLLYATVCFCILDGMAWNILSAGGLRFSITHMHTQEEVKWHL